MLVLLDALMGYVSRRLINNALSLPPSLSLSPSVSLSLFMTVLSRFLLRAHSRRRQVYILEATRDIPSLSLFSHVVTFREEFSRVRETPYVA